MQFPVQTFRHRLSPARGDVARQNGSGASLQNQKCRPFRQLVLLAGNFTLIQMKYTGENTVERVARVVEEFCLIDKVFSVALDNASSNIKSMKTLTPMFAGYLGPDPTPEPVDPSKRKYSLVHQRCACHIINLIIKSGLKRFKPYTEDFRTAINF